MSTLNWMTNTCGVILVWATAAVALPAQTLTTLYTFSGGKDGADSYALVQGTDASLYATTAYGGTGGTACGGYGCGKAFKITPTGTLTTLYDFDGTDGVGMAASLSNGPLLQATNGNFYGTTVFGGPFIHTCASGLCCGTIYQLAVSGGANVTGKLTTIYDFCPDDSCATGADPVAGVVEGADGYLYGATDGGGIGGGYGTIFKISLGGTLTTLYSFCAQGGDCVDGSYPYAGLVQATNGDLFGTTFSGGTSTNCAEIGLAGCGTIFAITPSGTLTTLHSFDETDGALPTAALVQATNGNLYGTTGDGGTSTNCPGLLQDVCGTLFEITPKGAFTTLYTFCSQGGSACTDGASPAGTLVQGTDGNLYGTTIAGGSHPCPQSGISLGCGTVFKITPSGALTTLYNFCSEQKGNICEDGAGPHSGVIQDTDGAFYGPAGGGPMRMARSSAYPWV